VIGAWGFGTAGESSVKTFAEERRPRLFIAFVHVSMFIICAHSFSKSRLLVFDVSVLITTLFSTERNWHLVVCSFGKARNFKIVCVPRNSILQMESKWAIFCK
jgi:hypothetical protein